MGTLHQHIHRHHRYLPLTKANKNNGLSTLHKTPLPLKSERCFCMAFGQRCLEVSRGFGGTTTSIFAEQKSQVS